MKNKINIKYKTNSLYILAILVYVVILTFSISFNILACNITILPSNGQYNVGDEVSLKIERIQTCGRCVLPLDQTKFNIENAKIIEIGSWTKEGIKDVIYVKIRFTEVGQVKFEVIRACTKNYNVARANFTVIDKIAQSSVKEESQTSSTNSALSNSSNISSSISSNISSNSNLIAASTNVSTTGSNVGTINESANTNNATNISVNASADENKTNNTNESANAIGEDENPDTSMQQINEQSFEQSQDDSNKFIDFIKSNLSYILIAFFLITGFVSYLMKLKFMRNILLLFSLVFLGFYLGGCPCIVGTTFNIFNIKNANIIYFVLLSFIPIATSFIWGRWFCGWFCPIGAFQKFLYSIKIKNPKNIFYKINDFFKKNDKILRYTKLIIFAIFGYLYISKGYNLFCHYEPFKAIFAFNGSLVNVTIAFIVFLLATINQRFFCKYLCPPGGILKLTSRFALKKIKVDPECCTGCKICTKDICPMDTLKCDEKNNKINIDHSECIRCLKCVDACKTKVYKI